MSRGDISKVMRGVLTPSLSYHTPFLSRSLTPSPRKHPSHACLVPSRSWHSTFLADDLYFPDSMNDLDDDNTENMTLPDPDISNLREIDSLIKSVQGNAEKEKLFTLIVANVRPFLPLFSVTCVQLHDDNNQCKIISRMHV